MNRPTFLEGVAVAFVASFIGGAAYGVLTTVFPGAVILRVVVAGIGLGYVLYLLTRSHNPTGRITSLTVWGVAAGVCWLLEPPLVLYMLAHVGLVWLIRSLYFHASALSALADLGLSLMGLVAAIWAATESGSTFLSIWCFLLVQALFVAIPARMDGNLHERQTHGGGEDRFERAHRAAQSALRRLSSVN